MIVTTLVPLAQGRREKGRGGVVRYKNGKNRESCVGMVRGSWEKKGKEGEEEKKSYSIFKNVGVGRIEG